MQFMKRQKVWVKLLLLFFFTLNILSLLLPASQNIPYCLYRVILKFTVSPFSLGLTLFYALELH